jgi:hypothetical protein
VYQKRLTQLIPRKRDLFVARIETLDTERIGGPSDIAGA